MSQPTAAEEMFHRLLIIAGIPESAIEREFAFNAPHTKHRADFHIPAASLLIEVEGGVFTQGRHTRPIGFTKDITKYNIVTMRGYRLLRTSSARHQMREVAGQAAELYRVATGLTGGV